MKKIIILSTFLCLMAIVFVTCKKSSDNSSNNTTPTTPTPTTNCNSASGLTASGITTSGATLSWTAASGATSYTLNYKVHTASSYTPVTNATSPYSLASLASSTLYDWQIVTNCSGGSPSTVSSTFTTTATPGCSQPTGLSTTSVTTTSATLNWNVVTGATSYNVKYSVSGTGSWTTVTPNPTTNSKSLTGLTVATNYQWQVSANCSAGTSTIANGSFSTAAPPSCSVPSTCQNGLTDAGETGRDCGGTSCNTCPVAATGEAKAIMDGCLWIATASLDSVYYNQSAGQFSFFLYSSSPANSSIEFDITASDPALNVGYDMSCPYAQFTTDATANGQYVHTFSGGTAIIHFTKFDTATHKMSGTFYMGATNSVSVTKYVSSGVFTDITPHGF